MPNIKAHDFENLTRRASLHWPEYLIPQAVSLQHIKANLNEKGLYVGWWKNLYTIKVDMGCTTGSSHSLMYPTGAMRRNMGEFYGTQLEALQALRHALTIECADKLRKLDAMIEIVKQKEI